MDDFSIAKYNRAVGDTVEHADRVRDQNDGDATFDQLAQVIKTFHAEGDVAHGQHFIDQQ